MSDETTDIRQGRDDEARRGEPREPQPGGARRRVGPRGPLDAVLSRLTFANVAATLALLVALGGTATAATLARDSVGSPQIKTDAVRSPEIRADAVRSSEIRDGSIRLADIATGARTALDAPRVRLAEDAEADVPSCSGALTDCSNLLSLALHSDSWLVQAKFTMRNNGNPATLGSACGLVENGTTVLDDVLMESLDVRFAPGSSEAVELTGVVTDAPDDTRVALRCTERSSDHLVVDDARITALEVGTVTRP